MLWYCGKIICWMVCSMLDRRGIMACLIVSSECQRQLQCSVVMVSLVIVQRLYCLEQCIDQQSWVRKPERPSLPRPLSLLGQIW